MNRLDGRVALISGAASGQGKATAILFAQAGARVVVADIADDAGQAVAREIGPNAIYVHLDISSQEQWSDAVSMTKERFDKLDTLVNNAAIYGPSTLLDTSNDYFERVINVNQRGTMLGMQICVPHLEEAGGGSIVNISSAAGTRGLPGLFAYSATKWAIRGMTRSAAVELAAKGIRVNTIVPGLIDTAMLSENPEGFNEQMASMIPISRMGRPEEVAKATLFLASDDASYITGVELAVDGGGNA